MAFKRTVARVESDDKPPTCFGLLPAVLARQATAKSVR